MRVELSPWTITETSYHRTQQSPLNNNRRRQRSSNSNNKNIATTTTDDDNNDILCRLSFVEQTNYSIRTRKRRKKQQQLQQSDITNIEDGLPVLTLTTPHRINVLVEGDSEQQQQQQQLYESSILQYSSRPSSTTAFLQEEKNLSSIPAIYDAEHNRIYALQQNNTKLICYNSSADSSNSSDIISITLSNPALDLSILHLPKGNTILYGTCQNSNIYIVYYNKERKICIEYFKSHNTNDDEYNNNTLYAGTLGYVIKQKPKLEQQQQQSATKKRKQQHDTKTTEPATTLTEFMIYQIFKTEQQQQQGNNNVTINQLKISIDLTTIIPIMSNRNSSTVTIPIKANIIKIRTLGFIEDNYNAITITFQTNNDDRMYYTTLMDINSSSRKNYYRTGTIIALPPGTTTHNIDLIGNTMIAAISNNNRLHIYDTIRGGQIYSELLSFFNEKDKDDDSNNNNNNNNNNHYNIFSLIADNKRFRIAIAYIDNDDNNNKAYVAYSYIHEEGITNIGQLIQHNTGRISLAAGLTSSIQIIQNYFNNNNKSTTEESQYLLNNDNTVVKPLDVSLSDTDELMDAIRKSTKQGLKHFHNACIRVMENYKDCTVPSYLQKAFDNACEIATSFDADITKTQISPNYGEIHNIQNTATNGSKKDNRHNENENTDNLQTTPINGIHHKMNGGRIVSNNEESPAAPVDSSAVSNEENMFELSNEFIHEATNLIIQLLLSMNNSNNESSREKTTIQNDARSILKKLIETGNLSARVQLTKVCSVHTLMRSLERSDQEKGDKQLSYNPFDLAMDMLKHCTDVSEHMFVSMLHYMTTRLQSVDVALYFNKINTHPSHARSNRLLLLNFLTEHDLSTDEKTEVKTIERQLIITGIATFLQNILNYSYCNDALLRDAISNELCNEEVIFLTKILLSVVRNNNTNMIEAKEYNLKCFVQWVSALSDYLRNSSSDKDNDDNNIEFIQQTLTSEMERTETILTLQSVLDEVKEYATMNPKDRKNNNTTTTLVGPYQIERLTF